MKNTLRVADAFTQNAEILFFTFSGFGNDVNEPTQKFLFFSAFGSDDARLLLYLIERSERVEFCLNN